VFFWISGTFFTGENNKFLPFSRWFLFVIGSFSAVGERGTKSLNTQFERINNNFSPYNLCFLQDTFFIDKLLLTKY